jgi:GNAT superfamily N-acetyltransferase
VARAKVEQASAGEERTRLDPPPGVTVTYGSAADIERLRPWWLALHRIHQEAAPEQGPFVTDDLSWSRRRDVYRHCLASPDSFLLLVARGARLIGYAMVAVQPDGATLWSDAWEVGDKMAELETICLVPEERGRGLDDFLLGWVDAGVERRGIRDLVIGAVPGNRAALRLYERRGFIPTWVYVTRFAARLERQINAGAEPDAAGQHQLQLVLAPLPVERANETWIQRN